MWNKNVNYNYYDYHGIIMIDARHNKYQLSQLGNLRISDHAGLSYLEKKNVAMFINFMTIINDN